MKLHYVTILAFAIFASCTQTKPKVSIIPKPTSVTIGTSFFQCTKNTTLFIAPEFAVAKKFIEAEIGHLTNLNLKQNSSKNNSNSISIEYTKEIAPEGYTLGITEEGVRINASDYGGAIYAMQSLKQLGFENNTNQSSTSAYKFPEVSVTDKPAFMWRGYMLDVSRHFFTVKEVKKVLDFMSELKLNRFHWHLADDQGFRVEIKSFPKLNSVGSWRVDYTSTDENTNAYWGRPVQKEGDKATYGGYYTHEQIKEVVAYAQERNIVILPEIDVPGHAQEFIASYPELACSHKHYTVATGAVREHNTICPSQEFTYTLLDGVISEIAELFPCEYIHVGGDECNKGDWHNHDQCQKLIKDKGLEDEHGLQSYFIKRVEKIVLSKGKKLIGWDEILEGGLAPEATVMSWRGIKGGIESVKQGHDVIMTPNFANYLDLKQGQSDSEPNIGYSEALLSKTYNYAIIPEELKGKGEEHILGTQGNLWSESISDYGKLTYMTFPRLYAVAENAWTPEEDQNWNDFITRLRPQMKELDKREVRYAKSVFNPWIHHTNCNNSIEVTLDAEVKPYQIRYTTDGTAPTEVSSLFENPIYLSKTSTVKAAMFDGMERLGNIVEKKFIVHKAKGVAVKDVISGEMLPHSKLVDLCYGQLHQGGDTAWVSYTKPMEVELQFDAPTTIHTIGINSLRHTLKNLYAVHRIQVFTVENGVEIKMADSGPMWEHSIQGRNIIKNKVACEIKNAKAIRVKVFPLPITPEGHVNAGKKPHMQIDEIVVL